MPPNKTEQQKTHQEQTNKTKVILVPPHKEKKYIHIYRLLVEANKVLTTTRRENVLIIVYKTNTKFTSFNNVFPFIVLDLLPTTQLTSVIEITRF